MSIRSSFYGFSAEVRGKVPWIIFVLIIVVVFAAGFITGFTAGEEKRIPIIIEKCSGNDAMINQDSGL